MITILLVEDEEPILGIIADLLQDEGYRTICAYNGAQALELARDTRPDLVLTDVMMPVLGGAELCRQLKADPATRDVPVIVMSAAGALPLDGCTPEAFIAKPFDLDALLRLVVRHLST